VRGGHKAQANQVSLPHPYKFEIETFDNTLDFSEAISVAPEKYSLLEATPFLYVENTE